jgi:hypothetical protein
MKAAVQQTEEATTGHNSASYGEMIAEDPGIVFRDEKALPELIKELEREIAEHEPDLTTDKGRKAIASRAAQIARRKTAIDAAGKARNEDLRIKINVVDSVRRTVRERLDALRDKARAPLDTWEEAEKNRIEFHQSMIQHIVDCGNGLIGGEPQPFGLLFRELEEKIEVGPAFEEFEAEAQQAKDAALAKLRTSFEEHQKREAEKAELARLREEAAKRDAEERERERQRAEEKQREAAAQAERDRIAAAERRAAEAATLAAQEAAAAERKKAEQEIARAAKERAEADEKARREAQAALDKANREREEAQQALLAERQRKEEEEKAAAARREDQEHRGTIMRAAKEALMEHGGIKEEAAKKLVLAIVAESIPRVAIQF